MCCSRLKPSFQFHSNAMFQASGSCTLSIAVYKKKSSHTMLNSKWLGLQTACQPDHMLAIHKLEFLLLTISVPTFRGSLSPSYQHFDLSTLNSSPFSHKSNAHLEWLQASHCQEGTFSIITDYKFCFFFAMDVTFLPWKFYWLFKYAIERNYSKTAY